MKYIILVVFVFFGFIINETYSQKKASIDSSELQRITKVINVSGSYLYKSGQQQLNAWTLLGVGTAMSISNVFVVKEEVFGYIGFGTTVSSIPFFIASAFNKRTSGEKLREFHFDTPLNESIIQSVNPSNEESPNYVMFSGKKYTVGDEVIYTYGDKAATIERFKRDPRNGLFYNVEIKLLHNGKVKSTSLEFIR